MRSHYYDEIVGQTIIYNGKPAIFEGYESNYEGDSWIIREVENGKSDTVWVATFTDVAGEILKQINEIRKKRIENKNT